MNEREFQMRWDRKGRDAWPFAVSKIQRDQHARLRSRGFTPEEAKRWAAVLKAEAAARKAEAQ